MIDSSSKYQFFASIIANIISFAHGCAVGWTSPFLPVLESDESPLESGKITVEDSSWIGSLLCLGALFGTIAFGFLADMVGRKISACLISLPQIGCWIGIICANSVFHLYIARFLAGIAAGGIFVVIPLYVTEISEDRIRGTLGSIMIFSLNLGTLVCFIMGTYLKYYVVQGILLFFPIVFLILFIFLPETPPYLMRCNKPKEAEAALRYFRGLPKVSNFITDKFIVELDNLTKYSSIMDNKKMPEVTSRIELNDFASRSAKKALIFGIVLVAMNQFSGCFALINYTAQIFKEAKTGLHPNISAIIVGIIQIFGSCGSTVLVDRLGRKKLYIISALCTALGLTVMGIYSYFQHFKYDVSNYTIIPVITLSFVIFIASVGILPLAFIVLSELSSQKIRSFVTSFCMSVMWLFAFIVIKYFSFLVTSIGLYGCMFFFSGCSFAGLLFVIFILPETKGKSFEEIQQVLEGT